MDLSRVFNFIAFTQKFRSITRDLHVQHHDRFESDMEHSYQLAMFAWYLNATNNLNYDTDLLLKYALVHDLVETYAGDTPALTSNEAHKLSKHEREKEAMTKIVSDHPEFLELYRYIQMYEDKADKESRFICGIDKVMPMLNELQHGSKYYKDNNITIEKWMAWLGSKLDKVSYAELEDGGFMEEIKKHLHIEKERMFAHS